MKVVLLLLALWSTDLDKISRINTLKKEAKEAYQKGDFQTAATTYQYLRDSLGVTEDEVTMNLANAYFQLRDTTNSVSTFRQLTQSKQPALRSVANQQLGVLANQQGKFEEALEHFKQAMKAAPQNDEARYNYEMVKKKIEEQKKQQQQNQDKKEQQQDQQKQDQENKDKQDQQKKEQQEQEKKEQQEKQDQQKKDQEQKDQQSKEQQQKEQKEQQEKEQQEKDANEKDKVPPSVSDKLKEMEMSEEKAKMILEAMKNQEKQYLQQNKRKATKPKDKGKPDW